MIVWTAILKESTHHLRGVTMMLTSAGRVLGLGLLGLVVVAQPAMAQKIRFNFGGSSSTRFQPGFQPTVTSGTPQTQSQPPKKGYYIQSRPGVSNESSSGWDQGGTFGNSPGRSFSPNRPGNVNSGGGFNNSGFNQGFNGGTGGFGYNPNSGYNQNSGYNPAPQNFNPLPQYVASGQPIVILGCREADLGFSLSANGHSWDRHVHAGKSYKCTDDREWYIKFHRGGEYGSAHYRLKAGVYEFQATPDHGWELVQKTDF